ncbi:DUF4258 domain-containing protein [[Phormidium] sp. ETS-05]|uniref:DUF4258 domain-containing protein n=1 Tax=[Phormidium] sp. ETS-05 TaxID=222819 RepID=UPI0018EF058C|nr:DUF4258 domain-containing protein [[Phormidium] sp. ETS-05]
MKSIEDIRQQLQAGEFEFSRHAFRRSVERNISEDEIKDTGKNVIIIEDYPDDKYSPSCLLLGFTGNGRPLHIQVSRLESDHVKIITIYEPDASEWIDYLERR